MSVLLFYGENLSGVGFAAEQFLAYNQGDISNCKGALVWKHF